MSASRIRPTWVRVLSNAALLDAFDAAWDVYGRSGDTVRLDLIHDEIIRREWAGTLTEEDWKCPTEPPKRP
jgi:hypothetical protein